MRILAADIGGTYSRFALFDSEPLRPLQSVELPSAAPDFPTVLDRLAEVRPDLAPEHADIIVLAVAGPVVSPDRVQPTNVPYAVDVAEVRKRRHLGPTLLINDFEAQALACLSPALESAVSLLPGAVLPAQSLRDVEKARETPVFCFPPPRPRERDAVCAVVGAGTGLGMALLLALPDTLVHTGEIRVLPSEGGHTAFAFMDEEERGFGAFLAERKGKAYACGDDAISGSGLSLLHAFLTGRDMDPTEVTALPDFTQSRTCTLFARFYGRACRHLALTGLPMAGLVITGGVAAKAPAVVQNDAFRSEFLNAPGKHGDLLARIPVWHNVNPHSGLWGAALAGARWQVGRLFHFVDAVGGVGIGEFV